MVLQAWLSIAFLICLFFFFLLFSFSPFTPAHEYYVFVCAAIASTTLSRPSSLHRSFIISLLQYLYLYIVIHTYTIRISCIYISYTPRIHNMNCNVHNVIYLYLCTQRERNSEGSRDGDGHCFTRRKNRKAFNDYDDDETIPLHVYANLHTNAAFGSVR